jgi:signal transduction histidine kinase
MRRSLVLRSLFVSVLIVFVFLVPLAISISHSADDRAVALGRSDALALSPILAIADVGVTGAIESVAKRALPREVSVVFPDGTVMGGGVVLDRDPINDVKALSRARRGESFVQEVAAGKVVYEPLQRSDGSIVVIQVLVPQRLLSRGVVRAWLLLIGLGLGLIALAVLLSDRLGRSVVRSVDTLAATANRLGSGDVAARMEPAGPPEVREVGRSLNRLAERIDELLGTERAALADLQHQLRTPVTALRAELDTLDDRQGINRIELGLEELTLTLDRIIREAARPTRQGIGISTDLVDIVRKRAEFWSVLAEDEHRRFHCNVPADPVAVTMVGTDLTTIVDVLIGNVFSHTEEGTAFTVSVHTAGNAAALIVDDEGQGFAVGFEAQRGTSAAGSTGLGLDIVRRLCDSAGGSMTLIRRSARGARVRVELPRAGVDHINR